MSSPDLFLPPALPLFPNSTACALAAQSRNLPSQLTPDLADSPPQGPSGTIPFPAASPRLNCLWPGLGQYLLTAGLSSRVAPQNNNLNMNTRSSAFTTPRSLRNKVTLCSWSHKAVWEVALLGHSDWALAVRALVSYYPATEEKSFKDSTHRDSALLGLRLVYFSPSPRSSFSVLQSPLSDAMQPGLERLVITLPVYSSVTIPDPESNKRQEYFSLLSFFFPLSASS